ARRRRTRRRRSAATGVIAGCEWIARGRAGRLGVCRRPPLRRLSLRPRVAGLYRPQAPLRVPERRFEAQRGEAPPERRPVLPARATWVLDACGARIGSWVPAVRRRIRRSPPRRAASSRAHTPDRTGPRPRAPDRMQDTPGVSRCRPRQSPAHPRRDLRASPTRTFSGGRAAVASLARDAGPPATATGR